MNEDERRRLEQLEEKTSEGDKGLFVRRSVFDEWAKNITKDIGRLYWFAGVMIVGLIGAVTASLHGRIG